MLFLFLVTVVLWNGIVVKTVSKLLSKRSKQLKKREAVILLQYGGNYIASYNDKNI